jgi:nucleoside-diphosphate kinase
MAQLERTLSIVKPDAVAAGAASDILSRFEKAGLTIIALKKMRLTEAQAQGFYAVHKERPFFSDLVKFMTEGPIVVSVLEGEGAIAKNRDLMGPTDSTKAPPGTIRGDHGTDIERNAAHGSDAPETARVEIAYFFNAMEIQVLVEALPA